MNDAKTKPEAKNGKKFLPWRKPRLGVLRGVEIFSAGEHKGKQYTVKDLHDIAKNFKRFSGDGPGPRINPPVVIGHEEDQSWLKKYDEAKNPDTGIPAAGWPTRLWVEGDKLKADIADLLPDVADAIAEKKYAAVSAEIYDKLPEGVDGEGKALRRLAILGGELPHVKDLRRLPHPEYSAFAEYSITARPTTLKISRIETLPDGAFRVFSEVNVMNRDEMMKQLLDAGVDQSVVETLDDKQLESICSAMSGGHEEPDGDEKFGEDTLPWESEDKDEAHQKFADHCKGMIGKYSDWYKNKFGEDAPVDVQDDDGDDEMPEDHEEPDGDEAPDEGGNEATDDEVAPDDGDGEIVDQDTEGDGEPEDEPIPDEQTDVAEEDLGGSDEDVLKDYKAKKEPKAKHFSEDTIAKIVEARVKEALKPVLSQVQKFSEQVSQQTESGIDAWLERMNREGRIQPSELDGRFSLREQVLHMNGVDRVVKFSEGGREIALTPREAFMKEIERRPALHKEKIKVTLGGEAKYFSESELDMMNVEKFCEDREHELKQLGFTVKEMTSILNDPNIPKASKAEILAGMKPKR